MKVNVFLPIVVSLILGFGGGYFFYGFSQKAKSVAAECHSNYQYINNRLGCQPQKGIRKHEYTEFTNRLNEYIANETAQERVKHVSVYFRDLYAGPTFGIKEKEAFAPASLLKVPMLITFLSLAEKDPQLLNKKIIYTGDSTVLEQTSRISSVLQEGKQYTIEDLLSRMIIYSDNLSYRVLVNSLKSISSENLFQDTLLELGLISPRTPFEDTITVKAYGSLFRGLYNSNYLSPEMSEKALGILSKSEYKNGLVAGVPDDIRVAHKFGERSGLPNAEKQLHDCGIVYYSENPYLLCVMTRGDDINELTSVIKTISEKVYKEVDSRRL